MVNVYAIVERNMDTAAVMAPRTTLAFKQEARIRVGRMFVRVGSNVFPKRLFVLPQKEPSALELSDRFYIVPGLRTHKKRPGLYLCISSVDKRCYLVPEALLLLRRTR